MNDVLENEVLPVVAELKEMYDASDMNSMFDVYGKFVDKQKKDESISDHEYEFYSIVCEMLKCYSHGTREDFEKRARRLLSRRNKTIVITDEVGGVAVVVDDKRYVVYIIPTEVSYKVLGEAYRRELRYRYNEFIKATLGELEALLKGSKPEFKLTEEQQRIRDNWNNTMNS